MNEEIRDLLGEEIKAEITDLSNLEAGNKEKSTAIDDLAKLYKLRIEETKLDRDFCEKYNRRVMEDEHHKSEVTNREREEQFKKEQLAEQVKERYFRVGVGIVLPLVFYAFWMKRGFKFEETGTFTSTTFRGLFGRFKPTKK